MNELLEKRAAIVNSMDALDAKVRCESRDMTPEEASEWDALEAQYKTLDAQIERAKTLEGRKAALVAGAGTVVGVDKRSAPAILKFGLGDTEQRAFCHYLRSGDKSSLEQRGYNATDMNITTAADGEVLVPVGMVPDIVARRDELMLAPKLGVRRIPGKGTTVNYPIDNEADVLFLTEAESATIDPDSPAMTEKAFTLVKYAKKIPLTWEILRDEDAGLMEFLNNWIGRGWAATHNSLLITEAAANGTAGVTFDSGTAIGAAEVPELVGKLAPEYQDGAQWLTNPTTLAYIQGLNGTSNWYFSPAPANFAGKPSLWGFPVNQSSYVTAYGLSAKSLIFGNFNFMGYREGTGLTVLRDPYSEASKGWVNLWVWFDAVYGVLQAEAIQYGAHPSA
jgi:HK97 family phage major capsid protein